MKILQVRFKNLNSLEGEWEIDFSHPAYASNGIFAITGPTGAGKTTLLDAICLALYGRTPRLKILSKSVNEVMTRQTGECFAEVIFATLKGVFRCHWSHHRARKRPEGELQQPRHEIVDHKKNIVLEHMIKNVATAVEDVTGMSFDQFTRSIMLAQGSFAAFLQASADDRAPLLEQITGTDIYSRISQKVHHHTADQQRKYTQMTEELDGLAILSEPQRVELKNSVAEKLLETEKIRKVIEEAQRSVSWLEKVETLKSDILKLEDEYSENQKKQQELEPQRSLLQKAKIASLHIPQHQHLQRLKTLQSEETQEISTIKHDSSTLKEVITNLRKQRETAVTLCQQDEKNLQDERTIIIEVKTLDAQIKDRSKRSIDVEEKMRIMQKRIEKLRSNVDNILSKRDSIKNELTNLHTYLTEHQSDSALVEKLAVFKEKNEQLQIKISNELQLNEQLTALQKQRDISSQNLEKNRQAHAQSQKDYTAAAAEYSAVRETLSTLRKKHPHLYQHHEQLTTRSSQLQKLNSLLTEREKVESEIGIIERKITRNKDEYRHAQSEEQTLLEKCVSQEQIVAHKEEILVLNRRIKSYEEERAELHKGDPCPLCGSTNHPFINDTTPTLHQDSGELKKDKELLLSLQKRITELQTKMSYSREQLADDQKRKREAEELVTAYAKELEELCKTQGLIQSAELDSIIKTEIEKVNAELSTLAQEQMRIDSLEHKAAELREKVDTLKESHLSREKQFNEDTINLSNLKEKEDEQKKELLKLGSSILDDLKLIAAQLTPFGVSSFEPGEIHEILRELEQRRTNWLEAKEKTHTLENEFRLTENAHDKEHTLLQSAMREGESIQQSVDRLAEELTSMTDTRKSKYGDKDPDSEEQRLREIFSASMQHRDETIESLRTKENKAVFLTDRLDRLLASTVKRAAQIDDEQKRFMHALNKDGFLKEEDFIVATMNEEQILELELLLKELDEKSTRLQTLLEEKKKAIHVEQAKNLSSDDISSLKNQIHEKNTLLNQILQEVGKLQGKLEDNEKLLHEQQQKREHLAKQEKELLRWQKLDWLIGSASGKKFRNFAQGITFEIMVEMANKNLMKMSDRYILIRDNIHPLNLQIIDNYRAGDIRSTQNLSGGESFLVSLALALGLSNMAGNNVRVDSFFLDEGFGTLDEETLDIALQTLAGLQQDGKMIGIISHISLLKERLDTQIQLVPGPGGHSTIEGPGVRML